MVMDPHSREFSGSMNGIQFENQSMRVLPNGNVVSGPRFDATFQDLSISELICLQTDPPTSKLASHLSNVTPHSSNISPYKSTSDEESPEDCEFSDSILRYISHMLLEEDMEDKSCMLQESLVLQTAEKSFYDVLGKRYPPSPEYDSTFVDQNGKRSYENFPGNYYYHASSSNYNSSYCIDNSWMQSLGKYSASQLQNLPISTLSQSSYSSTDGAVSNVDGLVNSPNSILQVLDLTSESQSVWQFQKGVEEASKFLPNGDELFVNLESNGFLRQEPELGTSEVAVKVEKKDDEEYSPVGSRGRKKPYRDDRDPDEEERSSKQVATYTESTLRSKTFDWVLLPCSEEGRFHMQELREALKNGKSVGVQQDRQSKVSNGRKGRGRKQSGKKEVIDLRTLLINCAQAVAADDLRSASELLKQIRQHSSPYGDGNQRLAHSFANGLEARLAGTGSQIYKGLISKRTSAADLLKAYHLYLAACPFRRVSDFCSNKMIRKVAANAARIHVIDFGILYGFQWPTLIKQLSVRPGGPPKLRITGIDSPQPGFRPAERVEETGSRLAAYAEEFNVPFEYNAIAKSWDTIRIEELKIERDEVLIVNCLHRAKNLHDETVTVESPRNIVLKLIRKINPVVFIHGIANGGFNAPFFVTRFREALFHFSAMFDMLETIVPREDQERMLLEKEIFGREALNVIACEGWERVERPETYKQWQVRNLRAGFMQLPFDREIREMAAYKVKKNYHKDFVIDEDSQWLLLGWKGRTIHALSTWKPPYGA
ncbi:GRAS domain-containing protein [Cephalotus follicularis]|uniref:GRAS domain-containing protein n=1 Tax=Cephalotus follicularis TaxID=3775 RepID=A0A1Q3C8H5_CEPFO|nr:GRAS domain-containing protein [Cephalotus follicularis]